MQSLAQMMRVLAVAAVLLILGLSRAEAAAARSNEVTTRKIVYDMDISNLIDEKIETIREVAGQLDPIDLDDINFPVLSFPKIYMLLHTGNAQNLAQIKRAGKCSMKYTNKKLHVDLRLGWEDLVFDYRYLIKAITKFQGDCHGQMTKLNIHIALEINFKNYHVTLKALNLENKGKINIKLEGHLLDWITNLAIKAATRVFPTITLNTIRDKTHGMIMHRIDELNLKLSSIVDERELFRFLDLSKESPNHRDFQQLISNAISDNN